MARFDLPESELRAYSPDVRIEPDFDEFWTRTLAESRAANTDGPTVTKIDTALRGVDVYDLTFPGFAGDPIRGWYLRPAGETADLPVVVEYVGYGGGRGLPHERLAWPTAGYAHVVMDTRGQGSTWGGGGVTPDPHGAGPSFPGVMTRGIEDPEAYYYRRLITDAVLCVDAVRALPVIDTSRISIAGISQGGGIALAVSGLRDDLAAALIDVPFLSHFERAVGMTDRNPYGEVNAYLRIHRGQRETVFRTLSYVDGVNFASRATAPALFSTGLQDVTCPPSTVFAAFNRYGGPKEIDVYEFNDHEGGAESRWPDLAAYLATRFT